MKKALSLIGGWLVLWGIAAAMAYYLYKEGTLYPVEAVGPQRLRDAMYAMYAIFGVTGLFSVVWGFACRTFWRNQRRYEIAASKHGAVFDVACPLSVDGDTLLVNRGFSLQEIDIRSIRWFHSGRVLSRFSRPLYLEIHRADGGKSTFIIGARHIPSVHEIIDKITRGRPYIMVSQGNHFSPSYRDCKRRYKAE
jgi:hypothetical protein